MKENLTDKELTDYDLVELYIRCVATFVERCSKYDLDINVPFKLGQNLWEKSIETLKKYRKEDSLRDSKR